MTSKKAYSLAQLIVVVGIIAIIALVTLPFFSRFFQMYRFRTTVDQLVSDIRAARQSAITSGNPVKITPIVLSKYPGLKDVSSGYALYYPTGGLVALPVNSITATAATASSWYELSTLPASGTPAACGNRAMKPRYIPVPITLQSNLLDIDKDGYWDLVFLPNGSIYTGPYPADGSGTPQYLTFSESLSDPKSATPSITLSTSHATAYDRYCISFALYGKVTVFPYHS